MPLDSLINQEREILFYLNDVYHATYMNWRHWEKIRRKCYKSLYLLTSIPLPWYFCASWRRTYIVISVAYCVCVCVRQTRASINQRNQICVKTSVLLMTFDTKYSHTKNTILYRMDKILSANLCSYVFHRIWPATEKSTNFNPLKPGGNETYVSHIGYLNNRYSRILYLWGLYGSRYK
jgi:hypothetical protein